MADETAGMLCDTCGRQIQKGEPYSSEVVGRRVVRGRIGDLSSEVTGVSKGQTRFRCKDHLQAEEERA